MSRIIDCSRVASASIKVTLEQLESVKEVLTEKKEDNSRRMRIFSSIVYIAGLMACIYLALIHKQISLDPFDTQAGYVVIITAGSASALFLAVLLLRNLIESKYYKVIFESEQKVNYWTKHLLRTNMSCKSYFGLRDGSANTTNYTIELGEDLDVAIEDVKKQLSSLEKGKSRLVGWLLAFVYYVAAIAVGALFVLLIQNGVVSAIMDIMTGVGVQDYDASIWSSAIYGICAFAGIFIGPFVTRYYFEKVRLITLNDSLIFLIVVSGFFGFIAALIVVAIIALVIGLVYAIVSFIIGVIVAIIAVAIIIAIIVGLLSGG